MTAKQRITELLQALSPTMLEVRDESHLHIGHREAKNGAHLRVSIVCEQFAGLTPLAKHRLIYAAVGNLEQIGVHALNISAHAPGGALLTTKETS